MSEMKLNNLEFIKLLPQFMRDDAAVHGLSVGIDTAIRRLADSVANLSTWDRIDYLSEKELDDLAWELNILWYDYGADIAVKRDVVKNSDMVYKHLGTKWAVENVIASYFGNGYIEEWFEYAGEPGHFIVHTTNPSLANERFTEFLNLLAKVKRSSAKLDRVSIDLTGQMVLAAGVGYHESIVESYSIGAVAP